MDSEFVGILREVAIAVAAIYAVRRATKSASDTIADESQRTRDHTDALVKTTNGALVALLDGDPLPTWQKEAIIHRDGRIDFRMLWIGRAYARLLSIDQQEYAGRTDIELHGDSAASEYGLADRLVLTSGTPAWSWERVTVPVTIPTGLVLIPNDMRIECRTRKWATVKHRPTGDVDVVGVAGQIVGFRWQHPETLETIGEFWFDPLTQANALQLLEEQRNAASRTDQSDEVDG